MYLNCHSYYSLRYGTMAVETLVEQAAALGIEALALTDINNSTGMVDFVKACAQHGIHAMGGIEFRNGDTYLYTAIARNSHGFMEINDFLTYHSQSGLPLPERAPPLEDAWFIYDFSHNPWQQKKRGSRHMREQELIGVRPSEVNRILGSPWKQDRSRLVIRHPVTFLHRDDHALHRHLRAIDHNILLSQLKPEHMAPGSDLLLSPDLLRCAYDETPDIRRNTEEILKDCHMSFDFTGVKNKRTFTGSMADDRVLLKKLALDGMEYRYGKGNPEARKRIAHELEVIDNLGFSSYFLITWDVIRYSMSRGFFHRGLLPEDHRCGSHRSGPLF